MDLKFAQTEQTQVVDGTTPGQLANWMRRLSHRRRVQIQLPREWKFCWFSCFSYWPHEALLLWRYGHERQKCSTYPWIAAHFLPEIPFLEKNFFFLSCATHLESLMYSTNRNVQLKLIRNVQLELNRNVQLKLKLRMCSWSWSWIGMCSWSWSWFGMCSWSSACRN